MILIVNLLSLSFIILIYYQLFLAFFVNIEPMTNYKNYNNNDPIILAQQNAGNIEYIKERLDDMQNLNKIVQDLSGNVTTLQTQVNGIVAAQQQYATQLTGGTPPNITGLD